MKGVRATEWESVLVPGDGDPRHGHNGYSNLGCRCQICRNAQSDYCLRRRDGRKARLADTDVEHGSYSTYTNYKCRCVACKRANADYARAYYARRKGGAA